MLSGLLAIAASYENLSRFEKPSKCGPAGEVRVQLHLRKREGAALSLECCKEEPCGWPSYDRRMSKGKSLVSSDSQEIGAHNAVQSLRKSPYDAAQA
jgi:hypothetical protein